MIKPIKQAPPYNYSSFPMIKPWTLKITEVSRIDEFEKYVRQFTAISSSLTN